MSVTTNNCQTYRDWQERKVQSKEIERAEMYLREALGDRFVAQNRLWLLAKSDYKITFL